jgi:hypothetical protein
MTTENTEKSYIITYYYQEFGDGGEIVEGSRSEVVGEKELAWYEANDRKSLNDGTWFRLWEVKPFTSEN